MAPLLKPLRLFAWHDLAHDKQLPPSAPGTYGWYFDANALPRVVPTSTCHRVHAPWVLLYVGIAPAKPSAGRPPSRSTLRKRLRSHFRGNARGSTLRLTLGCLVGDSLGIEPVLAGKGSRCSFGAGEAVLSTWIAEHARVCWVEHDRPWELEEDAIATLDLPLNLAGNRGHPFHSILSELRRAGRKRALARRAADPARA